MAERVELTTAIGARAWRERLEQAAKAARNFALRFEDVTPIHRAFAPMARQQKFDVSEMAIVTAIQAFAYRKPLVILPVTLAARFQHGCLIGRAKDRPAPPDGLRGRRIGVRAYTQTTGTWVRGILQNDYGLPPDCVRWVTQEGAHVEEYRDPAWVERTDPKLKLPDLLRDGKIDAAILGNDLPDDPEFAPIVDKPSEAGQAWFARHRVVPINHLLVVRRDLARDHPDALKELCDVIKAARPRPTGAIDMLPIGIDAIRPSLELVLRYCDQQSLLPRKIDPAEMFAEAAPFTN